MEDNKQLNNEGNTATPYDDVYRTLLNDCTSLIIPVVNEVFQKQHGDHEKITVLNNEFFITSEDGKQKERITDSNFIIGNTCYHFECQSTSDGTIIMRVFEYGSQIAIRDSSIEDNILTVKFPNAAILYLRQTKNTPDYMNICIKVPEASCSYRVRLNDCTEKGTISEYAKGTVIAMSKKVLEALAIKYSKVQEGVGKIMGGKILDYEAKRIRDEERVNTERERKRADEAESRADEAESRADEEKTRADKAEARNKELEAEIARLKGQGK